MIEPILLDTKIFIDERGAFYESYKKDLFKELTGLDILFMQDNHSISKKNVVRGMHYQWAEPMHKLVRVSCGAITDVVIDIRKNSKNFSKVYYFNLSEDNKRQLFVPAGFAHGFISLADNTHVQYKCSEQYNKYGESGINPFDKDLNIDWNTDLKNIIISDKDKNSKSFKEYCLDVKFKD
jgi:dTDP-4-dehydrorhamnose 3,5-epimerase